MICRGWGSGSNTKNLLIFQAFPIKMQMSRSVTRCKSLQISLNQLKLFSFSTLFCARSVPLGSCRSLFVDAIRLRSLNRKMCGECVLRSECDWQANQIKQGTRHHLWWPKVITRRTQQRTLSTMKETVERIKGIISWRWVNYADRMKALWTDKCWYSPRRT